MAAASVFLPFLPILPPQILLNNFLYDVAQVTVPLDNVDPEFVRKPHRWNLRLIRDAMLTLGPVSSVFDILTFAVLLAVFRAPERMFHTGWFIESMATQTLVLFVIRTADSPLRSRPSGALGWTVLGVVGIGIVRPYTPLGAPLGFVPLPPA
jgi:Mg2+-importing ATPase